MPVGLQVFDKDSQLIYDSTTWRYIRQVSQALPIITSTRWKSYRELDVKYNYPSYNPNVQMLFDPCTNSIIRGNGSAGTLITRVGFPSPYTIETATPLIKPMLVLGF